MSPMNRTLLAALLALAAAVSAEAQPLVVLDAGHGGRDPGAVGCGRQEAPNVLDVVLRTRPLLEGAGLRVALTRSDNTFVELRARAEFANQRSAAAFVSVHANANAGVAASGTETWIANGAGATTRNLGGALQRALVGAWGLRDRGVKEGNFTVITATRMPAALTEIGFINHCERDSALIGDGGRRQQMAQAHAEAIAAHLGAGAVEPGPAVGVLRGVVFEDRGAGLDDPSVRLGGVSVRVAQTGDTQRSGEGTGSFRFDLPPGSYRVEGSLAGFAAGSRACDVAAGQETWCSFGLGREAPPPPPDQAPPPPPPEDLGPPEDAAPPPPPDMGILDAATPDLAPAPAPEDMGRPDFERPPEGERPELGPILEDRGPGLFDNGVKGPGVQRVKHTGGCAAAPGAGGGAPWALLLLALPLLWPLRRRAGALALLGAGLLLPDPGRAHVPDLLPSGEVAVDWFDAPVRPHLHLEEPLLLTQGPYAEAVLSPDGRQVLLIHRDGAALSVMASQPGASPRLLVEGPGVGREPVWAEDSAAVWVRTPDQSAQALPVRGFALDGRPVVPAGEAAGPRLQIKGEAVWRGGHRISPEGDRFFLARQAPDGGHVALWGLATGLWLYRAADAALIPLGPAGHPRFDPSGAFLVFERTLDEGAALLGGDLFIVDLTDPDLRPLALTRTADRIELAPSLAAGQLVFVLPDGTVLMGALSR